MLALQPKGFILSGGPASVYEPGAPFIPAYVLESGLPVLGICYGMQALTHALGGQVAASDRARVRPGRGRDHAPTTRCCPTAASRSGCRTATASRRCPPGFSALARSGNSPIAAMGDLQRRYFGLQFHPEVHHTPGGQRDPAPLCGGYLPGARRIGRRNRSSPQSVERIRQQVGSEHGAGGGQRRGGFQRGHGAGAARRRRQLVAVFVDTGLLRQGEAAQVQTALRDSLGVELVTVDAVEQFLHALQGVTDPEQKRRIIGETVHPHLRSAGAPAGQAALPGAGHDLPGCGRIQRARTAPRPQRIKTHHNVGGLPEDMHFELVEPLRYLFKDEVRAVGEALGLPAEMVWRQPFPGPGLAVRCLGEVTPERAGAPARGGCHLHRRAGRGRAAAHAARRRQMQRHLPRLLPCCCRCARWA